MTRSGGGCTPANPEDVKRHLDYWLYGLVKVSEDLGNTRGLLRAIQEETIEMLLDRDRLRFPKDAGPVQVLRAYNRHLDEKGFLDADDVAYHRKDDGMTVTIGESCPYRGTCNWLHEDGAPIPCFRAIGMSELLRIAGRPAKDARLNRFGVPCHITFQDIRMEAIEDGD